MPFRENLFVSLYNTVPASPPLCPPYLSLSLSLSPCFSPAVILPFRASPFPAPRNKPDETSASSRNLIKPTVASVLHEVSSQSLLPLFFSFPSPSPLPPSPSPAGSRAGRVVAVAARARVFLGRVFGRVCRGFPSTGRFPSANINGRMKQGLLRKASALSCLLLPPPASPNNDGGCSVVYKAGCTLACSSLRRARRRGNYGRFPRQRQVSRREASEKSSATETSDRSALGTEMLRDPLAVHRCAEGLEGEAEE